MSRQFRLDQSDSKTIPVFNPKTGQMDSVTVYRLYDDQTGKKGGYVDDVKRLSPYGQDHSWVADEAIVAGDAFLGDDAVVQDQAIIYGAPRSAIGIWEDSVVSGHARICAGESGDINITGRAFIAGQAKILGTPFCNMLFCDDAHISGLTICYGSASAWNNTFLGEDVIVGGGLNIVGLACKNGIFIDHVNDGGGIDIQNWADLKKYDFLTNGKAIPKKDLNFLEQVTQAFYQCSFPEYLTNRKLTLFNHFDFNDDRDLL